MKLGVYKELHSSDDDLKQRKMSRRAKQILAAEARKAAEDDSFVSVLLLSELDVNKCTQAQFLEILINLDELSAKLPADKRSTYIEEVYNRMIQLLSRKVDIPPNRIMTTIKQLMMYHPVMTILTFDDLKKIGIEMERRSLIIHFDMSGSMRVAGFKPLVQTVIQLCTKLQIQGIEVHISLFGDGDQEKIHTTIGGRLLTLDEFAKGNYAPTGGSTQFCPSFERTKQFPTPYDAIIVSDGDFTDNISRLTFQPQCQTVFFVAPPWSPSGVEERHAKMISSSVHPTVAYIVSHCDDPFIVGVLRGLSEYSRIASQQALAGIKELDYAIECGQKFTTETTTLQIVPFIHLDKPGVREYLEQQYKKLTRRIRLVKNRPQFQSLSELFQQAKQTVENDEILGMADLESIPTQITTAKSVDKASRVVLSKDLFTCPITLDIMENPATTAPCGHMFDMDAINSYLNTTNICPICRTVISNVTQNYAFKNVIEAWLAQQQE
ncbi:unnamed protein product [Rotaria magnacalcarata]|uniref:RING-type domain-containing protein n=2 Tax=Rotaria magnacalcarata TaxID=392030 RepID=A0A816BRK8_9BILA|nr:unnamed protein product [Rotaria magnacalcarata]